MYLYEITEQFSNQLVDCVSAALPTSISHFALNAILSGDSFIELFARLVENLGSFVRLSLIAHLLESSWRCRLLLLYIAAFFIVILIRVIVLILILALVWIFIGAVAAIAAVVRVMMLKTMMVIERRVIQVAMLGKFVFKAVLIVVVWRGYGNRDSLCRLINGELVALLRDFSTRVSTFISISKKKLSTRGLLCHPISSFEHNHRARHWAMYWKTSTRHQYEIARSSQILSFWNPKLMLNK